MQNNDNSQKKRLYNSVYRQAKAEETRQKILEAADYLFKSTGYENVTIANIAEAAGVASQTIYVIFKSKHSLLLNLLKEASEDADNADIVKYTEPDRLIDNAIKTCIQKNEYRRLLLNSYGGTHMLQPALLRSFTKNEVQRRKVIEECLNKLPTLDSAQPTGNDFENGKKLDLLTAISDTAFHCYLVEQAGWTEDEVESALRQLLVFVTQSIHVGNADFAAEGPCS